MGRDKKPGHGVAPGGHAKERHKKITRDVNRPNPGLALLKVRPDVPNLKSKHQSYYELVENKDKKKKLEFQVGRISPFTLSSLSLTNSHSC